MTLNQRQTLLMALLVSAILLTLNIVVVTTGLGDSLYSGIKDFISPNLS